MQLAKKKKNAKNWTVLQRTGQCVIHFEESVGSKTNIKKHQRFPCYHCPKEYGKCDQNSGLRSKLSSGNFFKPFLRKQWR